MPGHSRLLCADGVNLSAMPGIHVLAPLEQKDVDGRDKPGHDEFCQSDPFHWLHLSQTLRKSNIGRQKSDLTASRLVRTGTPC
jgi:hypothetical protein